MTRDEILALEGEALWDAAFHACGMSRIVTWDFDADTPTWITDIYGGAFAILRAVRGDWAHMSDGASHRFQNELARMVPWFMDLEPHHIARAALLAQVKP